MFLAPAVLPPGKLDTDHGNVVAELVLPRAVTPAAGAAVGQAQQRRALGGLRVPGDEPGRRAHGLGLGLRAPVELPRQHGGGRVGQQDGDGEPDAGRPAQRRHRPRGEQRMPAQLEEIGIDVGDRAFQQLAPGGAHLCFPGGARCSSGRRALVGARPGQRFPVHLAVGGGGQRGHEVDHGGDQVAGQLGAAVFADHRGPGGEVVPGRHDGGEPERFAGLQDKRGRRGDRGQLLGDLLQLRQFDPETPHFHLVVGAAEVVELTVRPGRNLVAGPVEPFGDPRHGHEPFGGQLRLVAVAPGECVAADVQLAWRSRRDGPAVLVEDEGLVAGQRAADGRHVVAAGGVGAGRGHGGFGRAVHIEHAVVRRQLLGEPAGAAFTGDDHDLRGRQRVGAGGHQGRGQHDRARADRGDALGQVDVVGAVVGEVDDRRALSVQQVQQGAPQPAVEGGGQRVDAQPAGGEADLRQRREENAEAAIGDLHALGPSGGTGGVDHIGDLAGRGGRGRRCGVGFHVGFHGGFHGGFGINPGQVAGERRDPVAQQHFDAGVGEDVGEPFGRMAVVEQYGGRSEPPDGQQAGRGEPGAAGGHPDHGARPGPGFGQRRGDRRRVPGQPAEVEGAVGCGEGGLGGCALGPSVHRVEQTLQVFVNC